MGGEPGNEAHGGYAFCAVAALALIGRAGELDLRRLVHWAAHRQVGPHLVTPQLSPNALQHVAVPPGSTAARPGAAVV